MKNFLPIILMLLFLGSGLQAQVLFEDSFEDAIDDWTRIDRDGDGYNWEIVSAPLVVASGTKAISSASWNSTVGPLRPNNILITPPIDLTNQSGSILVDWKVYAQDQTWANEYYKVVAITDPTAAGVDAGDILYEGTVGANGMYVTLTGNLSDYVGGIVYVAFVHFNVTDQFRMNLDDVSVYKSSTKDVGVVKVLKPTNDGGCILIDRERVSVRVFNFGGSAVSDFEVNYQVNDGPVVTETVTQSIGPASFVVYDFNTRADLSALGSYDLKVWTNLPDDINADNDMTEVKVTNSDAVLTVHVKADNSSNQSWTLTDNTTGEVVATRGAYQWNIEESKDVCIFSDRCYSFKYTGQMGQGAYLEILIDGNRVAGNTDGTGVPASIDIPALGGGCPANEGKLSALKIDKYALTNTNVNVVGTIRNQGSDPISSFEASYTIDGGTPVTETFNTNILLGEEYDFTFMTPMAVNGMVIQDVEVTINSVNGEVDNIADNTLNQVVTALSQIPARYFVVEEGTGTWCGWCPRGTIGMETITSSHADAIGIAVHNNDPMDIGTYDATLISMIGGTGYPFSAVNRTFESDPNARDLEVAYQAEQAKLVPVKVNAAATYDPNTNEITVNVSSNVYAVELNGNYRFNVILTEDEVTGTGSAWAQANYYSGGNFGPMGGYENLPDPVPAAQMVYNHVARMMMGGFEGVAGSFPTNTVNLDEPAFQYKATLGAGMNVENMHAIGMLIDMSNRQIINAVKADISILTDVQDLVKNNEVKVFPNPFAGSTNIQVELGQPENVDVMVFNQLGQIVAERNYGKLSGKMILPFHADNLEQGLYIVHIKIGEEVVAKKVSVLR